MKKLVLLLGIAITLTSCQQKTTADLLVYNGHIYTLDSSFSTVEAMVVSEGKVVATGPSEFILENFEAADSMNLEGSFVYPGFNDAHTHFYWYAIGLDELNLVGTRSYDEVLQKVQEYAQSRNPGFIKGRGWDQNDWGQTDFPTNERLNELFPETPVLLSRVDGHAALVNDAALRYANISADTSIQGGKLLMKNGEFSGILIDNAVDLIEAPAPSEEQGRKALLRAQDSLARYGITSVTDAGLTTREIDLLQKMYKSGELLIRSNVLVSDKPELLNHYLANEKVTGEFLTVRGFKFYLDGALGSRGALMLEAYTDDTSNYGLMLSSRQHFVDAAMRLKEAGWQMAIHAIGDSANRLALSVYAEVLGDNSEDHRWRIEHAQIVHPADVQTFGKLNVIPSVQPTHATSDMYWAEERLGENRMVEAYPYRKLLEQNDLIVLGTDFPVEDIDPRKTFVAAVFRQDSAGFPPGGFLPAETLSRQQALRGMTQWPAYASFQENFKGKLLPGMAADFVVLNTDLMEAELQEVLSAKVLATYLDGQSIYQR